MDTQWNVVSVSAKVSLVYILWQHFLTDRAGEKKKLNQAQHFQIREVIYIPNNMQVCLFRFKNYLVVSSLWQYIVYHHFPRLMPGCLAFRLTCQCSATNYASSTLFTSHLKRLDSKCKAVTGAVILSSAVYSVYEWWLLTGLVRIIPETEIKMLVRSHGSII